MRRGVYPGSFNPPTRAHVAIAAAAITQRHLDRLLVVVSRQALDKEVPPGPTLADRVAVIDASFRHLGVVDVAITDDRLIADIAAGFDVVVMGRDKWDQLWDVRYYDSAAQRDQLLNTLPEVALAPRPREDSAPRPREDSAPRPREDSAPRPREDSAPRPSSADAGDRSPSPPEPAPQSVLVLDSSLATVSSTRARTDDASLMTPEARASGLWT